MLRCGEGMRGGCLSVIFQSRGAGQVSTTLCRETGVQKSVTYFRTTGNTLQNSKPYKTFI